MSQGLQSVKVGHYQRGGQEVRTIQMGEARNKKYTDGGGQKVRTILMNEARKFELYRWRRLESLNYTDEGGQKVRTIQIEKARKWELYR